jgi:23S rRNA (cytosine1962-C5)-methyltransferase
MPGALPTRHPRLRLHVTAAAESILRGGHPWLFASAVRDQNRPGEVGELAVLYDRKDRFLAIGLFDPQSPIRVRILHAGKPVTLDNAWWQQRLHQALHRRRTLFDENTTGFRWIHGENDGWPGLVLDRYGSVLVLKLYTVAWLPRLDPIISLIADTLQPQSLVLRLSRNIQEAARARFNLADGQLLTGQPIATTPTFLESGLRFEADVLRGQKTGFFLDQRDNRRRIARWSAGADVLNAFSFSGGFALHAAQAGAKSVADLDISQHALDAASRNFALNTHIPTVAACRHDTIRADAFAWLEANPTHRFDLVILDPPSFAKRETERAGAIHAYRRLAAAGIRTLRPNGVLVAASCSAHVTVDEFFGAITESAQASGRTFTQLETALHPPDHPATFPEAHYLKCLYLQVMASPDTR